MAWVKEVWDIIKSLFGIKSVQDQKEWDEFIMSRNKFLKEELQLAETRIAEQNKERDELIERFESQKKIINERRAQNPGYEKEYDEWVEREQILMLEIAAKNEEIAFWKERAIFIEKENELLLIQKETSNFKKQIKSND